MNSKKFISNIAKSLTHSEIDRIFAVAAKMEDVVILAMGQPDLNTPERVCNAGIEAIRNNKTKYTDDLGIKELRMAVANYMDRKFKVKYNAEKEIIITVGVSEALDSAIRSIVNPGDEVIVHEPCYNCYVPLIKLAGGIPVIVETVEEDKFKLNPKKLKDKITPRTKALILSYPNNPTGAVMTREDLEEIAKVVSESDIMVISDEIYGEMIYEGETISFASISNMKERTIAINGATKVYSMPGWRVAFACAEEEIIDAMVKVHQYSVINATSISQYAAIEAFNNCDDYVEEALKIYDERRNYVIERVKSMGLKCLKPKGSFFIFPSIKETGLTSKEFCDKLLLEGKVALVPGYEFGSCGEGYVRISYTTTIEDLKKAMDRIEKFLKTLK